MPCKYKAKQAKAATAAAAAVNSPSLPSVDVAAEVASWQFNQLTLEQSSRKLAADNYYGQRDANGLPHGRGVRLAPDKKIVDRQCGHWECGARTLPCASSARKASSIALSAVLPSHSALRNALQKRKKKTLFEID
jgi:hypothetical protein